MPEPMAVEGRVAEAAERPRPDRERLRALIRAEPDRQNPKATARTALELLAETTRTLEGPDAPGPGVENPEAAVRAAVLELRRTHPTLFDPSVEAAPASAPAPMPASRDWLLLDPTAQAAEADPTAEPRKM